MRRRTGLVRSIDRERAEVRLGRSGRLAQVADVRNDQSARERTRQYVRLLGHLQRGEENRLSPQDIYLVQRTLSIIHSLVRPESLFLFKRAYGIGEAIADMPTLSRDRGISLRYAESGLRRTRDLFLDTAAATDAGQINYKEVFLFC